jgi:hypothetical protein
MITRAASSYLALRTLLDVLFAYFFILFRLVFRTVVAVFFFIIGTGFIKGRIVGSCRFIITSCLAKIAAGSITENTIANTIALIIIPFSCHYLSANLASGVRALN